jgi:hypothetical protein
MQINQFEIWIADLSLQIGTEPGKTRFIFHSSLLKSTPSALSKEGQLLLNILSFIIGLI